MRHAVRLLIVILMLAFTGPVLAVDTEDETQPPSYTGTWVKNETLSDDPAESMKHDDRPQGGMGGGMGGGRRGGGMGGGRGAGGSGRGMPPGGDRTAQTDRKPPMMMQGLDRLEVFHEADEFAVTDANDILQSLRTDGRRIERWTPMGQVFETAKVSAEGIVVRSEGKDGPGRTVTYRLAEEGRRLIVVHMMRQPKSDKTVELKMVYDRAE